MAQLHFWIFLGFCDAALAVSLTAWLLLGVDAEAATLER